MAKVVPILRDGLREHRTAALLAATTAVLALSWWWRSRCLDFHWDGRQYAARCYNDAQALYGQRGWAEEVVPLPYAEAFNEYPVITGMFQYLTALVSSDVAAFYAWTAVLLSLCALATTWLLARDARPWVWALGLPLFFYAFHNWDLLAIALATWAFVLHRQDRPLASGVVMALAGMAKLYPLLFLPILGIAWLRREGRLGPLGWRFGLGAVGTIVLVNLPFWLMDPGLWWQTYTFHAGRAPGVESIWFVVRMFGEHGAHPVQAFVNGPWLDRVVAMAIIGALVVAGRAVWRGADVVVASFAVLLVFLMMNKVFSMQYALWILPFLAMVRVPWPRVAAFIAADALLFFAIWPFFIDQSFTPLAVAVVLRFTAMTALLVATVGPLLRPGAPSGSHPESEAGPAARAEPRGQ